MRKLIASLPRVPMRPRPEHREIAQKIADHSYVDHRRPLDPDYPPHFIVENEFGEIDHFRRFHGASAEIRDLLKAVSKSTCRQVPGPVGSPCD